MNLKRASRLASSALAVCGFLAISGAPPAPAQSRLSDKDVEKLMTNLKDDAKSFRPVFNSAVQKSAIRKTNQATDAKNLAVRFEKQAEAMLNTFKRTRKADTDLPLVLNSAQQIDRLVGDLTLGPPVTTNWQRIQAELQQLSGAFGLGGNQGAGPAADTFGGPSCLQAIGADRANRLVEDCLAVSPATHPPCNAQNPCDLIINEIRRSCALMKESAPSLCVQYK